MPKISPETSFSNVLKLSFTTTVSAVIIKNSCVSVYEKPDFWLGAVSQLTLEIKNGAYMRIFDDFFQIMEKAKFFSRN